ncbi:unnamed protein product, partial [Mesorhabditis spiculigera]
MRLFLLAIFVAVAVADLVDLSNEKPEQTKKEPPVKPKGLGPVGQFDEEHLPVEEPKDDSEGRKLRSSPTGSRLPGGDDLPIAGPDGEEIHVQNFADRIESGTDMDFWMRITCSACERTIKEARQHFPNSHSVSYSENRKWLWDKCMNYGAFWEKEHEGKKKQEQFVCEQIFKHRYSDFDRALDLAKQGRHNEICKMAKCIDLKL